MKTLDFRRLALALVFVALLAAAGGAIANTISLSADVDTDFLGKPGAIIKDGTSLGPPGYALGDAPLSPMRPDHSQMIQTNAVIPSGFHVSRTAVLYDCKSDTLYIGLDVSNSTLDPSGVPTGEISRAWDADGDGNACTVCNSMLTPAPVCPTTPGVLDPQLKGNGNQDIPLVNNSPLGEKYVIFLDLDGDGINDATLIVYDDGTPMDMDPMHKNFTDPCPGSAVVHAVIVAAGHEIAISPTSSPVVDLDVVYRLSSDPDYATHRDLEFKIGRIHNIPLSAGAGANALPFCTVNLKTNADTDYDASPEVTLDWGSFSFVTTANVQVSCNKLANPSQICRLPSTVSYTLQATNTSPDTNENITITDPDFAGSPWTFLSVAPGQTVTVDPAPTKTFDATFCGTEPFVNTMFVSAVPSDCCATGSATSSCQSTVFPPPPAQVSVSCTKGVDKPKLCALPGSVTYTLTVRNDSATDTPVSIVVSDPALNYSHTFTGVAHGDTRTATILKNFDASFCGSAPFVNTMSVTAMAEGCGCGTLTATSSCSASVAPPDTAKVRVTCTKAADKLSLCSLPDTVTYTLTGKNVSDTNTPVTMRIVDVALGVDQTFDNVAQGDIETVTVQKTFDTSFCGSDPFINTMTVSATATGCVCGTTSNTSSCTASVSMPPVTTVRVSCSKQVDKNQLCTLPDSVTYTLTGINTSITNTPVTLRIIDTALGVDQSFPGVAQGGSRQVVLTKTFDASFCGSGPFVNTMTVSAAAEGCACGTVTATTTCSASVAPPPVVNVQVSCNKQVDKPQICKLPDTVTYTLTAKNISTTNTPVTLRIVDVALGVDQSFPGVAQGQSKTVTLQKSFDASFCGSAPFVNTMSVTATAEGCACGTVSAVSSCSAAVAPPPTANVQVSCGKQVDKPKLCTLPDTVTYTLTGTNTSPTSTHVTLRIVDTVLGIDQTFTNVGPGESKSITAKKTFDATFCGASPFVNTMSVSAVAEGCACGTLTAASTCSVAVAPPDTARVNVSCGKTPSKTQVCALPDTVTYTLTATNMSDTDTPVAIRITDQELGVDQTFHNVPKGGSVTVNPAPSKTFDSSFCGAAPFVNTMLVSASAESGCVCGTTTATSVCTATVTLPKSSLITCSLLIDGQNNMGLNKSDLPKLVTYTATLCNTGQSSLDCGTSITGMPPGVVFNPAPGSDGTWTQTIAAGQCVTISGTVLLTPDMVPCPGQITFGAKVDTVVALSDGECACAPPPALECSNELTLNCPGLAQAYPANSHNLDRTFLGYQGLGADVITAIGGVFTIDSSNNWKNFVGAANPNSPGGFWPHFYTGTNDNYQIKNVVLVKQTPSFIQCSGVYAAKTVTQHGTANIRTWWPLMFEAPGTTWNLTITYGTPQFVTTDPITGKTIFVDYIDGPGKSPASVHSETWSWLVDADTSTLLRLLDLFHEVPFGLDEVPLISDEVLLPVLKDKVTRIDSMLRTGDTTGATLLLDDLELEVADACISSSPAMPNRTGTDTGIAQTDENPACCKILIDIEYIAKKLGLFGQQMR